MEATGREYTGPIPQLPSIDLGSDFVLQFGKHDFVLVPVSESALLNIPDLTLSRHFSLPKGLKNQTKLEKRRYLLLHIFPVNK